jgi:hypothetical protein
MVHTFIQLIRETFSSCRRNWVPILFAALIMGTVSFFAQKALQSKADFAVREGLMGVGIPPERYEDLNKRMEEGDDNAFNEMLEELNRVAGELDAMGEQELQAFAMTQQYRITGKILPVFGIFTILWFFIGLVSYSFFLILSVHPRSEPLLVVRETAAKIIPLLGLSLWIMLRSFLWIPVIGIVIAFFLMPRFLFSGVILLQEEVGVLESARRSYERTRGHWLAIIGTLLALTICLWVILLGAYFVSFFTGPLAGLLMAVCGQLVVGFVTVFVTLFAARFPASVKS